MIFLFRKTKIFFIFATVLWLVAVVLGRLFVFTEFAGVIAGILYPLLIGFLGEYILFMFSLAQAGKIHRSYNAILADDCDPEYYLEAYLDVRENGKKLKSTVFLTESSYATGLFLAGRTEEAREIINALIVRPDFSRQRVMDRADCYIDIGLFSLALGELTTVHSAIESAEEILETIPVGTPDYNRLFREITRLRLRTDVAEGNCEEAREYFEENGREYNTPYTRVNRMNTLANIYRATGETELLRKSLSYIAENGGTLAIARKAREELTTLPPAPPETASEEKHDNEE